MFNIEDMEKMYGIDLICNHKKKKHLKNVLSICNSFEMKTKKNNQLNNDKLENDKLNNHKLNNELIKSETNLKKFNDLVGRDNGFRRDDNDELLKLLIARLNLGRERYGHGIRISDDITQYGPGDNNWELMAEEELLDGMVYLGANLIRRRRERRDKYNSRRTNDDIIINTRTGRLWDDNKGRSMRF